MEKTRSVHQLDTPFSSVEWPKISQEDQDSILDLLCNLLSPIGHHRRAYIQPSKGKRSKTKKRKRDQAGDTQSERLVPPPPVVTSSLDVGLSNITRNLQPGASSSGSEIVFKNDKYPRAQPSPYKVIFVARSGTPSAFFSHLPQLVALASKKSQRVAEPIRLVGFSKACEERLSMCLGVPRVTSVALREDDTAQSKTLVDFVQQRVPVVDVPWLDEIGKGEYLATKIKTIQAPVGRKRQKKE